MLCGERRIMDNTRWGRQEPVSPRVGQGEGRAATAPDPRSYPLRTPTLPQETKASAKPHSVSSQHTWLSTKGLPQTQERGPRGALGCLAQAG